MTAKDEGRGDVQPREADERLYRRVFWRLLPLLMLGYAIAYIDRVNVGFAKLQMQGALGFDEATFGSAAGIMFVGYFMFEVPSNVLLEKIGARKTLLRIMVLWGIVASATVFVTTPAQFYVLRFLLGVFEAGFFPGVVLYLTYWFPEERRGRVIATFMSAPIVASIVAGPLSGATMKFLDGALGWQGWQWLYVTQGLPAIILGVVIYLTFADRPADAQWLKEGERQALSARAAAQSDRTSEMRSRGRLRELLTDPNILVLALIDLLLISATYVVVFWTPTLIGRWGVKDILEIGLLSAIPSAFGIVAMVLTSRSSDKRKERRRHFLAIVAIGAASAAMLPTVQDHMVLSLVALSLLLAGVVSATPLLIAAATDYLPPRLAAAGIALVTCIGVLGGALGPAVAGQISARTGNPMHSCYFVAGALLLAGLLFVGKSQIARTRAGSDHDKVPAHT